MGFKDKVALVTGAARNVGKAIALRYAQAGAHVYLNDIQADTLAEITRDWTQEGLRVSTAVADISDIDAMQAVVDRIESEQGRLDILVNNALVRVKDGRDRGPFLTVPLDAWHEFISRNLDGIFLTTQLAARVMARKETGSIINISSNGAILSHRQTLAYDTMKGGLEAFTRCAAVDLAPWNIRVNTLRPIAVQEQAPPGSDEEARQREMGKMVPMGRICWPTDVAAAAMFLASDEAKFITGQDFNIDGGMLEQSRPPELDITPPVGPGDISF